MASSALHIGDKGSPFLFFVFYISSTMVAGNGGCVALIFPRSAFVAFLDANPGTLLCLLGTQAVV